MSVRQDVIDLFVPIATIECKFIGGWRGFIEKYPEVYASGWHDWHIFKQGAIHHYQIDRYLKWWENQGFTLFSYKEGKPATWVDLCVSTHGNPTLPCNWISFDKVTGGAYLKGTEPGVLVGSEYNPVSLSDSLCTWPELLD